MAVEIKVPSSRRCELIDITSQVEKVISDSKIKDGLCVVFCPHTTAGIIINENSDPDVKQDLLDALEMMIPKIRFSHNEGNSDAHLKSSLVGSEKILIVENAKIVLGQWQAIYFAEFDGPRERKILIKIVPN
ncbi:MAG: secondary thiamine-phosphate synthase enzyme YjbQ [archaeon]